MAPDQSANSYSSNEIIRKNIPRLQIHGDKCCRTYTYKFTHRLPAQSALDQIQKHLCKSFAYSKDDYELPDDLEVSLSVRILRKFDQEAEVSVVSTVPEESCVYLYGLRVLPRLIEENLGTVVSIQNQLRGNWIR